MYKEIAEMNVGSRTPVSNTLLAAFKRPVDIDEKERDFFTAIAKQLELELPDSFFELGNLCQDSLALNFYMEPTLSGSPEEREKYRKIKKLRETISKALEWAPIEKAFSGMKCIKLAVQNCGKTIDEDVEIAFELPRESLVTLSEFPPA